MPKNTSSPLDHFLSQVVEKPHVFFTSNQKIVDSALEMAKHFYDDVKKVEQVPFSPFTELLTQGFDNNQIWEEIASQNEPFLDHAKITLKALNKRPVKEYSEDESTSDPSMDLDQQQDEEMEEEEEEGLDNEELDSIPEEEEEEDQEQSQDEDDDDEEIIPQVIDAEKEPKKKATSEVDDEFFNLEEFNKWTDKQEELDMMSDREDQDDEFDFDNDMGDEEDSDEDEDEGEDATEMTYNDFFSNSDEKPRNKKPYTPKKKQIEYQEELVDSEPEEDENDDDNNVDNRSEGSVRNLFGADDESDQETEGQEKSAFQKQQDRLAAQIEEYEDENVQDKHWTLRGEATAKARPVNSLLEEDLEFEHANKPVPVITQESTTTLEDMIKKRILDNMFDDVERKVDPTLRPFIPSKRVEISDEKAKQSLADIYQDEFTRKQTGTEKVDARDEALEKEHLNITDLFKTLCHKLDALSNFHYTPKAAKPEMSIVSNAAAISMEEVTPVNVSDATLLAPEEVYDKKRGDVKTAAEMDQDERKRVRAQKKKLKRKDRDMKERELKVMQKYNPQAGQRQAKTKAVKELLGQKNVTIIGKDGQKKTTSKAVTSASLF